MDRAFLIGPRIALRAITLDDMPHLLAWFNDRLVLEHLARQMPMNPVAERDWIERISRDEDHLVLLICLRDAGRPIGTIGLRNIRNHNRRADLGIAIGERACWAMGYGSEATELMLDFAFNTLDLHRVELSVYASNARAIRCYQRLGFIHEGTLREARFANGQREDILLYGLLAQEWRARPAPGLAAPGLGGPPGGQPPALPGGSPV